MMRIVTKFLLFSLVLFITIGTISAADNITDIQETGEQDFASQLTNDILETSNQQEVERVTNEKNIDKNKKLSEENKTTKKTSATITVTSNNYDQFFVKEEEDKYVKSTDLIRDGDTINLRGTFINKNFMVDKSIIFTSINSDAKLYNCTVYVMGEGASGSTVSNLDIYNNGTLLKGIQVKGSSNLTVRNNHVITYGLRAYGFVADYMNDSTIEYNYFERDGDDWRYIAFVIGVSHNNTIRNNSIICGANGIYLSIYGSYEADFVGGPCNYNFITENTINARGYITSWCYTIQVMGAHNTVTYNKVTGGFRGISTQDYESNYIAYNEVHAINEGIYACENATVINNYVQVNESATGITIGSDNVLITNNTIISEDGYGISISGNYANISNNNITSTGNYGIYSKGQYHDIIIENNRINSNNDGIMFKQQTRTKKINHVYVDRNNVVSEGDYAINFQEAGAFNAADVNITVTSSNVLSSVKGRGMVAYLGPANSNATVHVDSNQQITLNSQNYTKWFTNGIANSNIEQNATITLQGTFNNTNFTFNKKVHIIGNNSTINQGTITLSGDSHESTITNLKIYNKEKSVTTHGIELLEVNNCQITNVEIDNYADYESFAIFLYGASGSTIKNNTLKTSGDYVNDAIFVYGSDSNTITDNAIYLNQSDLQLEYDDSIMFNDKIGTITEVLHNHGVILLYSSNNEINKNNIRVNAQFKSYTFPTNECKNSVVGIDIYFDSHRNIVTNNNINITSFGPYVYGMGVLGGNWGSSILTSNATNNRYINNTVNLEGGYYGTGFIAGRNSIDTLVESNVFTIKLFKDNHTSGDYGSGIVLENSTKTNIYKNTITTKASSLYNIELYDSSNNNIIYNTINSNGTNPYGVAGTRSSNNTIKSNIFFLKKEDLGQSTSAQHSDSIDAGDEAIMFNSLSSNNNITNNTIHINSKTTVKLTEETTNNYVMENSLIANESVADNSVVNLGINNIVSNNFVHFVNATVNPVEAYVGSTITLVANVNTTTNDYSNLSVTFKLGSNTVGTSKVVNGKSSIKYNISELWNPTTYQITAFVTGTNFQNATAISQAVFDKYPDKTYVKVAKVHGIVGNKVVLTANVTSVTGGKIGSGQAEFYLDGVLISTVDLKLGTASTTYSINKNADIKTHNITVIYLGTKDYENSSNSNLLCVQSQTNITLENSTAIIGENVVIKANIVSGGKTINDGNMKVFIGNILLNTVNIKKGIVNDSIKIPATFDKGNYTLRVLFEGNDSVSNAIATSKIVLNPITPVLHFNNTWVDIGENTSLILVIDNGKAGDDLCLADDGNVSIKLNDQLLKDANGNIIYGVVKNGKLTFKFTAPSQLQGSQNLTFIFNGNSKFLPANKTFVSGLNVGKINVTVTVNDIGNVLANSKIIVTGKFTESTGKVISNSNVRIIINGVKNYAKTDKNGTYTFETIATTPGVNNLSVGYGGNTKYHAYEKNITFIVSKQNVTVTVEPIVEVPAGTNATINGIFKTTAGKTIGNSNVKIIVNGVKYTSRTDGNGVYSLSVLVTKVGVNNLSVGYGGNAKYNAYEVNSTFNVGKQDVVVTFDPVREVSAGTNVTITGKFKDNLGKAITNSNVRVFVNGVKYLARTDGNGVYSLSVLVTKVGVNNLSVGYGGNAKYNAYEVNSTFNVGKQDVVVTFDPVKEVSAGTNVTITGKFTDNLGKVIANSNVRVFVNGVKYLARTDKYGKYSLSVLVTKVGVNNLSVGYGGNAKYNAYEVNSTFNVGKQNVIVTYNKISDVKKGKNVTITGKFTDNLGKAISNSNVKVVINGVKNLVRTDSKGIYMFTQQMNTIGNYNVIVGYGGNAKYNAYETNTTFKVIT